MIFLRQHKTGHTIFALNKTPVYRTNMGYLRGETDTVFCFKAGQRRFARLYNKSNGLPLPPNDVNEKTASSIERRKQIMNNRCISRTIKFRLFYLLSAYNLT